MPALQFDNNGPELVVAETFFYLLDVGTSNTLVLYNESVKISLQQPAQHTPMNIVEFKMKLVEESSTPHQSTSKVGYSRSVHTVH
jgi:hypothetical protein